MTVTIRVDIANLDPMGGVDPRLRLGCSRVAVSDCSTVSSGLRVALGSRNLDTYIHLLRELWGMVLGFEFLQGSRLGGLGLGSDAQGWV